MRMCVHLHCVCEFVYVRASVHACECAFMRADRRLCVCRLTVAMSEWLTVAMSEFTFVHDCVSCHMWLFLCDLFSVAVCGRVCLYPGCRPILPQVQKVSIHASVHSYVFVRACVHACVAAGRSAGCRAIPCHTVPCRAMHLRSHVCVYVHIRTCMGIHKYTGVHLCVWCPCALRAVCGVCLRGCVDG